MALPSIEDIKSLAGGVKRETSEYDTRGTVTKVSGTTAYVKIDGSDIETPMDSSCAVVKPGDVVSVHISHGDAHIVGNRTDMALGEDSITRIIAEKGKVIERRMEDVEGNYSTIRQSVEGISTEVASVAGDVSRVEQTVSGLSSTVSSVSGEVSAMKQSPNGFEWSVASTGDVEAAVRGSDSTGSNIVPGTYDMSGWTTQNGGVVSPRSDYDPRTSAISLSNPSTSENFIYSPYFYVKNGETYTLTFHMATSNLLSYDVFLLHKDSTATGWAQTVMGNQTAGGYKSVTFTATVPTGLARLRFDNNGQKDASKAGYFWIAAVSMRKGSAVKEWSACPSDVSSFMDYGVTKSGALTIGNKSGGSFVGTRAQIDSDSFDILDSDGVTPLASYGTTATVGKTSSAHVVIGNETNGSAAQLAIYRGSTLGLTLGTSTIISHNGHGFYHPGGLWFMPSNSEYNKYQLAEQNYGMPHAALAMKGSYAYVVAGQNENSYLTCVNSNTGKRVSVGVGSGGDNRGVYDNISGKWVIYTNGTGTKIYSQIATSITSGSDRRLKHDIEYFENGQMDAFFDSLKPCQFVMNDDAEETKRFGFIAQDVQESVKAHLDGNHAKYMVVSEEKVSEDADSETRLYMTYGELIAVCVDQIQELKKRVAELEEKLNGEI